MVAEVGFFVEQALRMTAVLQAAIDNHRHSRAGVPEFRCMISATPMEAAYQPSVRLAAGTAPGGLWVVALSPIEGAGRVSQVPRRATQIIERVVFLLRPRIATIGRVVLLLRPRVATIGRVVFLLRPMVATAGCAGEMRRVATSIARVFAPLLQPRSASGTLRAGNRSIAWAFVGRSGPCSKPRPSTTATIDRPSRAPRCRT